MIIIDRHMTMLEHNPGIQSNDDRYARFRAKYPAPRANSHPWPHLDRDRMPAFLRKDYEPDPVSPDEIVEAYDFKYGR